MYLILSYVILGLWMLIYIRRVNDTNTGMFSGSRHEYKRDLSGFDPDYYPGFIAVWLAAPVTLPVLLFYLAIDYSADKIYNRWFKPKS